MWPRKKKTLLLFTKVSWCENNCTTCCTAQKFDTLTIIYYFRYFATSYSKSIRLIVQHDKKKDDHFKMILILHKYTRPLAIISFTLFLRYQGEKMIFSHITNSRFYALNKLKSLLPAQNASRRDTENAAERWTFEWPFRRMQKIGFQVCGMRTCNIGRMMLVLKKIR